MNVYDFDKTIYHTDSTVDFFKYCLKRKPSLLRYIFKQGFYGVLFVTGLYEKTRFKEKFYCFFKGIPDIDAFINDFWDKNIGGIHKWYLEQANDEDVVISASPDFLVEAAMKRISTAKVMGSRVDKKNGSYTGLNCYGEEKVRRFYEEYPDSKIDKFYSDSYSDSPLAKLADESFIVAGEELIPWDMSKCK